MRATTTLGIVAVILIVIPLHRSSAAEPVEIDLDIRGSHVVFAPVDNLLAVAPPDREGVITFVDVKTGKTWKSDTPRESFSTGGQAKIAFSPDGKLLASAIGSSSRGGLSVWRVANGSLCEGFAEAKEGLKSFALGIAFAPDGKTILTGSDRVHLWRLRDDGSLASGPDLSPIDSGVRERPISSLAFSPTGLAVAAGNWRQHFKMDPSRPRLSERWEGRMLLFVSTGNTMAGVPLALPPGNLYDTHFSPDGKMLAVLTGIEARAATGRLPAGRPSRVAPRPATPSSSALTIWSVPPRGIPASRSDKATNVAALLADVVDRADIMVRKYEPEPDGFGEALAHAALGVIGTSDEARVEGGVLKVTNLTTINQFAGRAKRSISFAGEPPANWQRMKPELLFETHFSKVVSKPTSTMTLDSLLTCFAFSPDGAMIATGGEDKLIRLWDVRKKRVVTTLEGHSEGIQSLTFSADGTMLASAGGEVKVWYLTGAPRIAAIPKDEPEPDKAKPDVAETRDMLRSWTYAAGKIEVKARVIRIRNGKLTLQKEDTSTIVIAIAKLSETDKEFLSRTKPRTKKKKKKKKS
ncbi:MAG: hypothetical protein H8E66_06000 [Planctomycetes bacterium]|nr:hypothetical protein [Planctomycetota bacterium]